ncbi:RTX toxin [Vibrio alginolyticus]|nr:retention module-containing protein [Vibrio alginolyticus]KPN04332.1 RTX toxin [Vibrio alginolyticus]
MSTHTVPQSAIVNAVKGEVLVLGLDGNVKVIKAGDELRPGEIIITENNASLDVQINNELYLVDANCVACLPVPSSEPLEPVLVQSPVNGLVTFDPTAIGSADFDANDIAAIQQAILDGADPTAILEATAAGAGAEGSANAGYVTVEYNNPEVLASTFFETSATRSGEDDRDEDDGLNVTIFADGGQSLQSSVIEGSISLSSYPQTISSSVLVEAGDLALDTASFVPETSSLESLLTELNSDITSGGQPVAFVYDEAQNAIIGTQGGNEVLRIEIEATSLGRDLELEVVTTISQGIDHVASVADGQVSIVGDQINITFDITGADIGGNSIQAPIDFTTTVIDGDDPAPQNVTFENVESSSTPITGTFVDIGSDQLATVTFNQEGLSQFDGLLSDNQATEAVLSEDGSTITLSIAGSNETVLTISLNTDGTYQFEQFKPLEQTNGEDTIELSLPTTIVDFDQDTASNTFTMTILDGDNPVIENVTGLSLDEAGVDQGSQEGAVVTSGTGAITTAVGSDIIDHYELEPTEFNVGGELQSQGQVVQLELASESNGVRTYEGFIELDGVRITIFDVAIDAPALGEYQFNLYEQLDHTGANDDSLTFSLPVYAVDADGDRSSITDGSNTPEAAQIVIQVQDDVPTIDDVDALAVDEDDLSSIGSDQSDSLLAQGNFTTTQGSDRVVSYQLESGTDPLNGLESQGRPISLTETTNSDGSFTYSATAEGDAIFTLQVNPDGSYSFTLEGPIDHAVGSDSLTLDFTIVATDFDGDTSSLVLPVTITDDVPTINDVVALTVDEDDLSSVGSDQSQPTLVEGQFTTTQGSDGVVQYQLDVNADPLNSLQSQGQTVSIAETQNADGSYTYSATANGSAVFTLILNTDGSYSFELQGPIDHAANSDSLTLDFNVIATDFDGDTSQIVLPVTIVDDKPTITDVDAITVDEDDLGTIGSDQTDPISIDGNFTTTQGSDRVVSYQLDASSTPVDGLTSQGVAVTLTETANGDGSFTYEATAGTEAVFTLTVNTDGSYNFTLEGSIDHAVDSDELTLNFPIIATDFDGDTTNATIPVTIVDDKPVITDVDAITVDEDDLASIGSDQSNPISIDGNFTTTQGSDRVVSYQLDGTSTPVDGLTSQGVAVTLTETANGDGSFTYEATAGSEAVFTLTVNTDGSYNFTLQGPIDHAVGSDELILNFPIIATDFDGDTVTETIPVTIVDDVPTITAVDALSVDEDDLSGVGSDPGGDLFVEGAFTTTQGSDRVVSYQLDSTADPVAGLTSQGEAIILVETANGDGSFTYVATADGNPVFTLNVATDGTYDFTLQGPIDHAANSDSLTIDFPIIATDFDGDTTSATIPVTITDDAPIIDNVVPLAVDEDDLSGIGSDQTDAVFVAGAFTTTQGSDRVVSYQLDSTSDPVSGLTSQGEPVILVETANPDGSFTYVATADGNPVFTMNVNADGTYDFRLEGPIDHALNSDELVLNFPIIATDFDGDTTTATIPVTITDDVPTINNVVPLTVDEDDLATIGSDQNDDAFMSGSFSTTEGSDSVVKYQLDATADPVAGLTSHGEPVVLAETANGDGSFTYTATANGNDVFELVVKPDGSYTFTLQGPLDHAVNSDSLQIDFPIIATDFDGDTSTETLPVTIVDDKPTITDVDAIRVDEDDLATIGSDGSDPISIDGNFTTTQGSDGVVQYQLDVNADSLNGLQSQGQTVSIAETQNADGSYTYSATANGSAVFTLILNTDGSYSFELQGPIDHAANSDSLTLDFSVIATDFDGDTSQIVLPVTIVDDKPTITDVDAITVDEDDLGTIGSDQTDPISIDGSFTTTQGSDRVVSYQLDASATPVDGLTSQGVAVTLTETANADGSFTYEATAGSEAVFTLTVNTDGSYNFTLEGPIDHAVDSDELTLNFPIIATDFDGDTTNATIPVTIVDDKPVITDVDTITVDEDDLASIGSDQSNPISIDGNFTTTQGSDRVVSYQLDASATPVDGLTSQGVAVTLIETANGDGSFTYEATAGGNPVFTLTVDTDGSYNFTLEGPIDHAVDSDELTLNFPIIATDFDGDTVTETIPVTIVDDVPTITAVDALSVDEDDLSGVGSDQTDAVFVEGAFTTIQGSDRVVSYQLDSTADPVAGLTSQGEAITLVETANGDGSFTYVATADGNPVFTLNVATDGTYDFTLQGPIDHAANSDSLTIDFPIIATDFDGDTTSATIPVTITDDAPIIDNVLPLAVDEDDLSGIGSDQTDAVFVEGAFTTTQGSDRVVSYQLDSTSDPVAGLTSQGEPVTLVETANADGSFTYVATADGNPVFTMNVNADGTYSFRLEGPIDHALNSDELVLNFPIIATDFDGDTTTATIPVTITDDVPTINNVVPLTVDEDDLATIGSDQNDDAFMSGSFSTTEGSDSVVKYQLDATADPVAGLTSHGEPVVLAETTNGDGSFTYTATADGNAVFELVVKPDGSYTFTLQGPLDHAVNSDGLQIDFPIIATDFDGDTSSKTLPVTIVDDKPTITDVDAIRVDEDDLATIGSDGSDPISIDGNFTTTQGSDGVVSYQLDTAATPVDGLTSQGVAVTLAETANGDGSYTYEATAGTEAVFTLTVNTDGSYNFTLQGPIDHATDSDELTLNFPIIATDFDGDTTTETIPVTIVDDKPTITDVDAITVDEDDLGTIGSDQTGPISIDGNFTTTQGSDRVVSYQLDASATPVAGLTSQGVAVTLTETANADGSFTYQATAGTESVFTLTVNTDGSYNFTLEGPIDHAVDSDELTLNFPIIATDFDGDTTNATIPVTIVDDKPVITDVDSITVDEDDLASIGSDQSNPISIDGNFTTTQGSDRVVSYQLDGTSTPVDGLTSQGVAVTLIETANGDGSFTYEATAGGNPVFTLTVDTDGSYNFTLEGPIDHAVDSDELTLNFPIIATDFDGDTVTETIPVTIVDDVPTITAVDALSVDEDDLTGVGSDPGGDLFVEGAFTTTQGSDRVVSYQLDSTADPVAGLTSQGEAITLVETANGDGSFTYVATADGNPVFTLNVAADGTYDFTLQGPIDHAANSDSLTIDFPIIATDFDGDTTSATIPVTITDDAPIIDNVVPLAVDEDDLSGIGSDQTDAVFVEGAFTTTQGSDRVVSYQLDSTADPVSGLTSQGEPVTLVETANADGSFTYVATADGNPVFTMKVNADGTYNFRLEGPVDHALNSDELVLNFPIIATDFDGDTTTATIPVTITDDVPTIDNVVPLTVDEDDLASIGSDQNDNAFMSGSFSTTEGSDSVVKYQLDATADPVAGLTSHGEPVVLAETTNGDGSFTYTATADGNAVFELVVKPDGSYTFTLQGPLDHAVNSDSLQIDFPIIATDFDGDTSSKTLPVTIVDDKPTITDVDAIRVDEDDLATIGSDGSDPISFDGNFTTTQGSDGVASYQLDAAATPVDGLTSQGVAVTLTETANGDGSYTYEATAGTEAVFTLTVNTDGSYNFTLQGPIDHAVDSDELTLNFPIIATDFDGDTTTETIPVTIVDDKPTITDVDAITVDEDDLGTIGSDQTDPISIDGNFTTTQGSDRVVSYQLDASATPVAGLTSQGVAVTLTETANGDGSFTYEAAAGTEAVFTLTVNTDGSYNFTLEGPIDHAVDSDELTLNFPIIATDFDGDTSAETIPVKIVDDKPTLGGIEATSVQTVDEDDIPTVGSDGTQSNSIAGNFIATDGSDGILEYSVSDLTTPVQGLTSGGQSLVMVEVSNAGGVSVYEARIDGTTTPVFRVTLDASDDSYTFDLLAPLDHPNADGQNELVINLPINATDFDGDVSNNITLPITVVDDVPTIDGLLAGSEQTVDEDDLPAGTDAASAEDTVISGTFDITGGADQVASIQLSDLTTPVASLTSDGEAITLVLSSSANGVNVYQGVAGNPAEVVFELTLDATNNSYEFDLQKPLDHPDGNQQNEIVINLPVTATDNDGDTSPAFTLPITVVDDVPVVTNIESLRVDEDDLPLGSDGTKEPLTVSGEFEVTSADGIDAFELDLSSNPIPNLKSGGEEVTLSQDVGASTADARVYVGQTPGGVTVFTLTLHQDGKYDFELSGQLDHAVNSDEILLNLPVKITDGDNDIITATLPVTIVDDKPTIDAISSGSTLSVDEDDIPSQGSDDTPESNIIGGNFDVTDGADSIVSFQLDSLTSPVSGLTSGGQPLELVEFSNSNGVIEYRAYVQGTTDTVFKLTLNGSADSYEFELLGALDHPAGNDENSLVINFPVNATDFDGDVSNNITLPITVVDDVPAIVKVTDSSQQTVDEDDLSGGSDTTSSDSTVLNGGFEVVAGADKIVSYQVSDLDAVVSGLTSNGSSIELNLVSTNGGVTSYEAVITGTSTKIFTLSLDANNDSYQFELLGPIDHDAVQGENNLVIDIPITVTDFDGDTSSSLNLPITVVDDIPEIKSADALAVDEDDLANGSQATNKDSLEATGNFDTVEGADTVVSYQLDLTSNPIPGVTSGGFAVTLVQTAVSNNNFTYQGQTPDGNSVFTLVLNADGSYKFTLEGALDHSTQGEDTLILDLPVFATDVDGDTAGINLPVTITDDVPTLHDASISRVEGQGSRTVRLFRDPVEGDDDLGADDAQVTSFSADDSGIYFKQNGVDSDSVDLNGSDQVVFVHKVLDGVDTEIGRLVVRTDGSVSFRPNDDLDHTETDSIDFTINVVATDGDGDIADADVDISIRDRNAQIDTSTVTAFEDQGRDGVVVGVDSANTQDNLSTLDVSPAKVDLVINLHDIDRNESLGDITIRDADTHNGTFYYRDGSGNYIELTSVGNTVVLDASNVEQSFNGELVSLDNLYFVPDRHTSTDASGIDPRIRVEILNNGTPDHTINGRLDIEVAAVADIATWTASSEFNYSVDEDGNNVALNITAETQDTSNPEGIVYELVFTQGEGNAELVYSDGSAIPKSGGVYLVDASRIDEVQVDPIDNFSGEIRIDVTAITTENNNPLLGKDTARSETETIIIDVNPVADKGSFTVNRINVFEDNARTQNTVDPVTDHDPLQLSEVITMKPSADLDGSEALFVRISNFSIDGVTLVWLDSANPSQIVEVTDSGGNVLYYEVPESELANVEVLPPLHSNDDFTFNVEGIVKDTASLSTGTTEDVLSLGSKTVIVGVKGVADIPDTVLIDAGNVWNRFVDGDVAGIETTIEENGVVNLNFSVVSGEVADRPQDDSEAITVILSNIPDGVRVVDSDGSSVDLTFVGYDGNGQPIYEANITGLNFNSGIQIIPEASSTENIAITGTIIVTENDGHSRVIEREVRIKVEPVIDAQDNYVVRSEGDEDTRFDIDWKPTLVQSPDTDEFFSDVTISGFPPGSTVYVDGVAQTLVSGTLTLSPQAGESEQDFSAKISQSGYVQVQLEQDSSTDFDLTTTVTVKEIDHEYVDASNPGEGIAEKTINGTVNVQVNPIVEPEDNTGAIDDQTRLLVTESGGGATDIVKSDDQGNIDFTINTSMGGESGAHIIKYQEFDASSDEVVTQLVVQFHNVDPEILNQLVIVGALNEGGGRWTVTDEDNFSIKAPSGLDLTPSDDSDDGDNGGLSQIGLTIYAEVNDLGEDLGNEKDATVVRQTDVTLEFPTVLTPKMSVAAEIQVADDVQIQALEDNSINLGAQLTSKVDAINADGVEDVLTIIVDPTAPGIPPGLVITGTDVDFVNGKYVFQAHIDASGNITGLDGLTMHLAEDYAGDFELPIRFVTKDTESGDEKENNVQFPVQVLPVADVPSSAGDQPLDSDVTPNVRVDIVGTFGLDANKQPVTDLNNDVPTADGVGYEDGLIQLNLSVDFADQFNNTQGGRETLTNIKLELDDTTLGEFVDANGNSLGTSIEFNEAEILAGALDNVLFKPKENYPVGGGQNTVKINIEGEITDEAVFDQSILNNSGDNIDVRTFTDDVTFEVTPVVDDITITGADPTQPITVIGDEDTLISLNQSGSGVSISLNDNDGSESFVSLKLTGLPDDFIVKSNSSDYVVKNNGGGEWSIQLKDLTQTSIDLSDIQIKPPKHFSGEAEIGITVFIQEELLQVPTERNNNFTLIVNPIGDDVDVNPDTSAAGNEGEDIVINVNALVVDNKESIGDGANYQENDPETLRVEVSNVPDGASVSLPDGTVFTDQGGGIFVLEINAQDLDQVVFNSGDRNDNSWDGSLHFKVQAVDTGLDGSQSLGSAEEFDVTVDVEAVNDRPEFVNTVDVETPEDTPMLLDGFSITDIDAVLDDPNAEYVLNVNVDSGILELNPTLIATYNLTVSGDGTDSVELKGTVADLNNAIADGLIEFNPDLNFFGDVQVDVTVDDQGNEGIVIGGVDDTLNTNSSSFNIEVTAVNDTPETTPVTLPDIEEDSGVFSISEADLIANATDVENDNLTVSNVQLTDPNSGSITFNSGTGEWEFTPAPDYNGPVEITYTITDDGTTSGASDPKSVNGSASFNVTEVNDAPTTSEVTLSDIAEDSTAVDITQADLLANASDIENDTLMVSNVQLVDPSSGTLDFDNVTGTWSFTPAPGYNGKVDLTYDITDNGTTNGVSDPQTVSGTATFEVTEVNDAPVTSEVTLSSTEEDGGSVTITATELLSNASDPESDNLTVDNVVLVDPASGTLTQVSATEWTFEPAADFFGDVNFTYEITDDGTTNGAPDPITIAGTAVLNVEATNDAPEITATSVTDTINEADGQKVTGISVSDVDFAGAQANESMTVTLTVTEGDLRVEPPAGSGVTVGAGMAGEITLMGTPDNINSVLGATDASEGVFVDAGDVNAASITLSVKVEDNGVYFENASGTALEANQDFTINVTPVADAPTLSINPQFNYIRQIAASQTASSQGLAIVGIMAALTDIDEVLSLELTGVPASAEVTSGVSPSGISFDGTTWTVPSDEIDTLEIVATDTNSGIDVGSYDISLTAISTESNGDEAQSSPVQISLDVSSDSDDIDQSTAVDDSYLVSGDTGTNLIGGDGDDVILGGDGDDVLIGGLGSDILTGGDGSDIFKWTVDSVDEGAVDTITDFTVNEDSIDLREVISDLNNSMIDMDDLLGHISADYDASTESVSLNITTDANVQQTIVVENLGTSIDFNGLSSNEIVESLLNNGVIDNG